MDFLRVFDLPACSLVARCWPASKAAPPCWYSSNAHVGDHHETLAHQCSSSQASRGNLDGQFLRMSLQSGSGRQHAQHSAMQTPCSLTASTTPVALWSCSSVSLKSARDRHLNSRLPTWDPVLGASSCMQLRDGVAFYRR